MRHSSASRSVRVKFHRARQRGGVVAGLELRRSLFNLREVGDEVVGDDDLAMHDGEVALCSGI